MLLLPRLGRFLFALVVAVSLVGASPLLAEPVEIVDTTPEIGPELNDFPGFSVGINDGFGDIIGEDSRVYVDSSQAGVNDLAFVIQTGATDLGSNVVVIYIDSVPGGLADTTGIADNSNAHLAAITGLGMNSETSNVTFATGTGENEDFLANFAITVTANPSAPPPYHHRVYDLSNLAMQSSAATGMIAGNTETLLVSVAMSDLGLTVNQRDSFRYVVTLIDPATAVRSDEMHGVAAGITFTQGINDLTLNPDDWNRFVTYGPGAGGNGGGDDSGGGCAAATGVYRGSTSSLWLLIVVAVILGGIASARIRLARSGASEHR